MGGSCIVEGFYDEEAGVWVATSEDVPGLVAEAETVEELMAECARLIPELLRANAASPPAGALETRFRFEAVRECRI